MGHVARPPSPPRPRPRRDPAPTSSCSAHQSGKSRTSASTAGPPAALCEILGHQRRLAATQQHPIPFQRDARNHMPQEPVQLRRIQTQRRLGDRYRFLILDSNGRRLPQSREVDAQGRLDGRARLLTLLGFGFEASCSARMAVVLAPPPRAAFSAPGSRARPLWIMDG